MLAALLIFAYAVAVAWGVPSLLAPLTRNGARARLGLFVWLTAMATTLISLGVALAVLVRSAVVGWSRLAEAVCREVAGNSCTPVVYRNALYELGLGIAAILATLTAMVLAWRYGRRFHRGRRQTRVHAEAARIAGRQLTAELDSIKVLDAPQRAAYCVPGRPGTIVVTSGALAVLEPAQLNAVIAHERAHLAGRHHLLVAVTRGLAAIFPGVPLFDRGPAELTRLTEMRADDVAASQAGRRPLIEALLAMGTGVTVPGLTVPGVTIPKGALAAAGYAVAQRVQRLLDPPRRTPQTPVLIALLVLLPALSGMVFALAGIS
jgi:Zn-dependent protease with chaperone function